MNSTRTVSVDDPGDVVELGQTRRHATPAQVTPAALDPVEPPLYAAPRMPGGAHAGEWIVTGTWAQMVAFARYGQHGRPVDIRRALSWT